MSRVVLLLLVVGALACGRPEPASRRDGGALAVGARPPAVLDEACRPERRLAPRPVERLRARPRLPRAIPPESLLVAPRRIDGRARARDPVVARYAASAIATFPTVVEGDRRTITTPILPDAARYASDLRIRLRAPAAASLRIVAFQPGDRREDRPGRSYVVPLSASPALDGVHEVKVDLASLVRANWRPRRRVEAGRVDAFALAIEGGDADAAILELVFEREDARFEGQAAVAAVERDGVVRPALVLEPGVTVSIPVSIRPDAATLRWYGAGGDGAVITLGVREGGRERTIARLPLGARWTISRSDFAAYAGRPIELVLRASRSIAFVGTPEWLADASPRPPDVVVYLVDLLLATQLGAYGNERGVSPTMDRLLAEGLAFGRARSTSAWTKPAVPTILTGIHPSVHRVGATGFHDRLPPSVEGLAHRFRANGHRAGSFAASPLGSTLSGLEAGFDVAVTPSAFDGAIGPMGEATAAQLHERLLSFVDEEPTRPFFAFVHTVDVHEYRRDWFRSGPYPGDRPYDRAIRQQDAALAELLDALARRGREVVLVLLSDHGESLGEYGRRGHGSSLFQSLLHVPLVFHAPGLLPPGTVDDLASIEDVAPTLVDLFELPAFPEADGISLLRYAFGPTRSPARDLVTSSREWFYYPTDHEPAWYSAESLVGTKAVAIDDGRRWTFDLRRDPCELDPAHRDPALGVALARERRRLGERARSFAARHGARAQAPVDADVIEQLRALGYVE